MGFRKQFKEWLASTRREAVEMAYRFYADHGASVSPGTIIGLLVVLVVFGATVGTSMSAVVDINTTGWPSPVATLFDATLPLLVGIAFIILVLRAAGIKVGR